MDSIGTMYMGVRKEEASGIARFLRKLKASQDCTIVGADFKTDCPWAAFANASYSQVHDSNDGHRVAAALGGSAHPGRVVNPAALAVSEKLSLSGKELITAIVIGYDVAARVRGMENPPPSNTYASAAMSSRMMGLDEDKAICAMGIAGYLSSSRFPERRGDDTGHLIEGYFAKIGIEAAMLADEGMFGPPMGDDRRLTTRFRERGLGKDFEIMNIYIKPYPTCRMTHGAIEAILAIKEDTNLEPSEVKEVILHQLTTGMYTAVKRVSPDSYFKSCEGNLSYIAACAIIDGEVGERQFTRDRIADPKIHELIQKIKVIPNEDLDAIYPENARPIIVEIKTTNGKTYTKRVDYAWGDPQRPLTDEELFQKFRRWAGPSITDEKALEIKQTIFKLDKLENVATLTKLLSK